MTSPTDGVSQVVLKLTLMDGSHRYVGMPAPAAARWLAFSPERGVTVRSAIVVSGSLHEWPVGYGRDDELAKAN